MNQIFFHEIILSLQGKYEKIIRHKVDRQTLVFLRLSSKGIKPSSSATSPDSAGTSLTRFLGLEVELEGRSGDVSYREAAGTSMQVFFPVSLTFGR